MKFSVYMTNVSTKILAERYSEICSHKQNGGQINSYKIR